MTEHEIIIEIIDGLKPLFEKARKEKLWFHHQGLSGNLWFSPDELEELQAEGRFIWGAINWELEPPELYVEMLENIIKEAGEKSRKEIERVKQRMNNNR